ncbi:glycosyltransferase [Vibrio cyclitrophicus]|uniref:glycosyltransferase n=1 Tax=Vibrio cyclitrophicus TaxID=47951 RepID=UPI0002DECF35|nr:glycosyltransferase [Vibrio cyclitrophicus]
MFIFGPRLPKSSDNIGGAVVLHEDFLHQLFLNDCEHIQFDTNKSNHKYRIIFIFSLLIFLFYNRKNLSSEIIFINSSSDYLYIIPLIKFLFPRSKIILRKFGSEIKDTYMGNSGRIKKYLCGYIVNKCTMLLYLETKKLCDYFVENVTCDVKWFPNVRTTKKDNFCSVNESKTEMKKIIFLGHLKKDKGVSDLFKTADLVDNCIFDLYGVDCENFAKLKKPNNVNLCGIVERENVFEIISKYDILFLPSYKEGYPGVIVESLLCGVPVISTNVGGIPEMIDGRNGLLCDPGDITGFKSAINTVIKNQDRFTLNAKKSGLLYDSSRVTKAIIDYILNQ